MKAHKDHSKNNIEILIVEDSATQTVQLKHLLEQEKFRVFAASNGKQAVVYLNEHKPALIISDIIMPEMDGYELCKHIKSHESSRDIPVILLTSLSNSEDVLEGLACGADNFITKPYSEEYLLLHIDQVLANEKLHKHERVRVGVEIMFGGKRRFITADQQQMLSLLISTYEAAVHKNLELVQTQNELRSLNERLEELVKERTAALSAEVAFRKRSEDQVKKLNRLYALLSNINQAIVRIHDVKQLLKDACMIAVDEGNFQRAWIGIVNNGTKKIEVSASAGLTNNCFNNSAETMDIEDSDVYPIAEVIRSGKHFILNNISANERGNGIWGQNSLALGFNSFAAFPLIVLGKTVGSFCIYSNEINFFDGQEIGLLDEMADDISFAIEFEKKDAERKDAEKALEKSEEEYRQFFEDDLTGDYISTPDGKILSCNPAFVKIFGFASVEEALNTDMNTLYCEPQEREIFLRLLTEKNRLEYFESKILRRDSTRGYCIENAVGIFEPQGNLVQIRGYIFDESKRKLLEQQLTQSQKLESIGTLSSGIAHDFNNILGIIMGHSSLMERVKENPQKLSQSIEAITNATRRGASLVKQLLTFARKTESLFETTYINEIIKEIKKFLQETIHKTIVISTSLQEDLPPINADGSQIHQVLMNLCVNARDAMPNGGTIAISTSIIQSKTIQQQFPNIIARQYVKIEVADTGMGMDEATKQRIFEPFFTTKGLGKGTGLGLATVFGIIEQHKGFIDVQSKVGEGTTFTIYFPVTEHVPSDSQAKNIITEEAHGGTETILLIEDEETLRELVKTVLITQGYTVLTSEDGIRGVEIYQSNKNEIALVLTDMGLPLLSGQDVAKNIRKINPKAKVIIASGFIDPEIMTVMLQSGLKYFIQKPYSHNELLQKVREVLDNNE